MSDTAADVQALTRALPELPKPEWFAVDTEGAEYDVTFVDDRNQAHNLAIDQDDIEDNESLITALYRADQMVSYAALHAAALLAENAANLAAMLATQREAAGLEQLLIDAKTEIEALKADALRWKAFARHCELAVGRAIKRFLSPDQSDMDPELVDLAAELFKDGPPPTAAIDAAQSTKKDGA